ncbi:hypothetical protein DFJ77DRAFT_446202 [Powellomyces hirtus]|nr:hypothetical protein DFJ77DRAFT_446202 [Powellomyces hirtus]
MRQFWSTSHPLCQIVNPPSWIPPQCDAMRVSIHDAERICFLLGTTELRKFLPISWFSIQGSLPHQHHITSVSSRAQGQQMLPSVFWCSILLLVTATEITSAVVPRQQDIAVASSISNIGAAATSPDASANTPPRASQVVSDAIPATPPTPIATASLPSRPLETQQSPPSFPPVPQNSRVLPTPVIEPPATPLIPIPATVFPSPPIALPAEDDPVAIPLPPVGPTVPSNIPVLPSNPILPTLPVIFETAGIPNPPVISDIPVILETAGIPGTPVTPVVITPPGGPPTTITSVRQAAPTPVMANQAGRPTLAAVPPGASGSPTETETSSTAGRAGQDKDDTKPKVSGGISRTLGVTFGVIGAGLVLAALGIYIFRKVGLRKSQEFRRRLRKRNETYASPSPQGSLQRLNSKPSFGSFNGTDTLDSVPPTTYPGDMFPYPSTAYDSHTMYVDPYGAAIQGRTAVS